MRHGAHGFPRTPKPINCGVQRKGLRPSQVFFCDRVMPVPEGIGLLMPSAHRWWTASPARFEHRVPGFDGVVPQHPSPGLRHRRIRRDPVVGAHRHPLSMNGGCIWLELHHLLLLCAHQPAFSAGLFWWFVGGAVTGQGGGATATEKTALQSICCRGDAPASRWRISCLNGGLYRAGRLFRPSRTLARPTEHQSMDKLLSARKKKLVSVKMRLERSFWWPWLATTVQPRQGHLCIGRCMDRGLGERC